MSYAVALGVKPIQSSHFRNKLSIYSIPRTITDGIAVDSDPVLEKEVFCAYGADLKFKESLEETGLFQQTFDLMLVSRYSGELYSLVNSNKTLEFDFRALKWRLVDWHDLQGLRLYFTMFLRRVDFA